MSRKIANATITKSSTVLMKIPYLMIGAPAASASATLAKLCAHREIHEQIAEVGVAHQQPDRRHDDVVDERRDDLAEGGADDDAYGHVHDVAAHRELFEFF